MEINIQYAIDRVRCRIGDAGLHAIAAMLARGNEKKENKRP